MKRKEFNKSSADLIQEKFSLEEFSAKDIPLFLYALEELAKTNEDLKSEIEDSPDIAIQINVPGVVQAYIEIKGGKLTAKQGSRADADTILEMNERLGRDIFSGKIDLAAANLQHKLKIIGSMIEVLKLRRLLEYVWDILDLLDPLDLHT